MPEDMSVAAKLAARFGSLPGVMMYSFISSRAPSSAAVRRYS